MQYRKLPRGEEKISVIGLGTVYYHHSDISEVEKTVRTALDHGINYFDTIMEEAQAFEHYGRAFQGMSRDAYYLQMHFGATYESGKYAWTRDLQKIKDAFGEQLRQLKTDYTDVGLVHCIDQGDDYADVMNSGLWEYMKELKASGKVRHLGCSTHNPDILRKFLDTGIVDIAMFSVNMAYDYATDEERKNTYAMGQLDSRYKLYEECKSAGVGLTVMKPYGGGRLLREEFSPFKRAFSTNQCIQYALDRPGVMTVLPGVPNPEYLCRALEFFDATEEERDYSMIYDFAPENVDGTCVYCNHCQPCPAGLDIGAINKYYDLASVGDELAWRHYANLQVKANQCIQCGHCEKQCPFHVRQMARMREIDVFFSKNI